MALPVVLVTGQLLTAAVWQPLVDAWGDREIIIADNQSDDTIENLAERLLASAPRRFILIAHAMGGFVAFEVLRRAPERVARLVLMSTLAPADNAAQTARRQGYLDLVKNGQFDQVVEERIPLLFPKHERGDERLLAIARQMAADTGPAVFLAQQRAIMARIDSRDSLAKVAVPTLLVWGEEDGITSREHHLEMHHLVAGSQLAVIPGVGHLPTLEAPHTVIPLLQEFIDG